jgi:hypothetical protein
LNDSADFELFETLSELSSISTAVLGKGFSFVGHVEDRYWADFPDCNGVRRLSRTMQNILLPATVSVAQRAAGAIRSPIICRHSPDDLSPALQGKGGGVTSRSYTAPRSAPGYPGYPAHDEEKGRWGANTVCFGFFMHTAIKIVMY